MELTDQPNSDWPAFRARLSALLQIGVGAMNTLETLTRLQRLLHDEFDQAKATGLHLDAAPGLLVCGARASVVDPNLLAIRWESEFSPGNRWLRPAGVCMPLGFYDEFDLYVGFQGGGLPPTLMAVASNAPGGYTTFNPALSGFESAEGHGSHFVEALNRALYLNVDMLHG